MVTDPGGLPLNRMVRVDYMALKGGVRDIVLRLRSDRRWDMVFVRITF